MLFFAIHVFRMTTFFLIAGFFAHLSFHRRGASGFIKDRLQRIAVPLLVGWPILFAAMVAVTIWAADFPNGGPLPGPRRWPPVLPQFPLTHLWFLYVLLELYVAALVLRTGIVWLDPNGRVRARVDGLIDLVMRSRFAPAILAVPIGIALCLDPTWVAWFGVRTPDSSLVTNLQAWIGFGTAFGFGWLLHRQVDLIRMLERRWLLNSVLAVVLIAASFFLAIANGAPSASQLQRHQARGRGLLRVGDLDHDLCGCWTRFSLLFRFQRHAPLSRRRVLLALPHSPADPDGAAGRGLRPRLAVADQIRGDHAGLATLMFASYQLLVRYSFIGMVLNGRRVRQAARQPDQISAIRQTSS